MLYTTLDDALRRNIGNAFREPKDLGEWVLDDQRCIANTGTGPVQQDALRTLDFFIAYTHMIHDQYDESFSRAGIVECALVSVPGSTCRTRLHEQGLPIENPWFLRGLGVRVAGSDGMDVSLVVPFSVFESMGFLDRRWMMGNEYWLHILPVFGPSGGLAHMVNTCPVCGIPSFDDDLFFASHANSGRTMDDGTHVSSPVFWKPLSSTPIPLGRLCDLRWLLTPITAVPDRDRIRYDGQPIDWKWGDGSVTTVNGDGTLSTVRPR